MTVSDKGGRKYGRLTWHIGAVFSWGAAAEFGLIWVVAGKSPVDLWLAVVQLVVISGMALGALFLAAHQISDGGNGKKSLAVFMVFMFGIWPVWAWTLPDNGATSYGYWKIMGLALIASFILMFVIAVVQKYAAGRKGVDKFFLLAGMFDRIPSWIKYVIFGTLAFGGMFTWQVLPDLNVMTYVDSWGQSIMYSLINTVLLGVLTGLFRKNKRDSGTMRITNDLVNRVQLLEALNNITAELKDMRNAIKHMK